jgi:REP element-mobilizing transposase RayT
MHHVSSSPNRIFKGLLSCNKQRRQSSGGFAGPEDYALFLKKFGSFSEIYKIKVRAYCLMPNHFHLYIQTPKGNLSRFMQAMLTSLPQ